MSDPRLSSGEMQPIPALLPRGPGHQFVLYGDSCSGVPGAPHERTFAAVNSVVRRLTPPPEFILFPGDEIIGLVAGAGELRQQWRHWLEHEMAWLDRDRTPLWHTTGNHTTYDPMSEAVFRDVLNLPANGPPEQRGLSYWVRRDDLLLVFVHTLWSGLGGEGHVETDWLHQVLGEHADARHKLVLGHHPIFPVNGFAGPYQREIGPEYAGHFWDLLVAAEVRAYLCSHILAFDVQVHRGVLQICTAGAGTAHRMPEGVEYLHCVQAALDDDGLRYQVLDTDGLARERLTWPPPPDDDAAWVELPPGEQAAPWTGSLAPGHSLRLHARGEVAAEASAAQTILSAYAPGTLAPLWIGLRGPGQTLTVIMGPVPGRSPAYWLGPDLAAEREMDVRLAIVPEMGPGGVLCRSGDDPRWTSCAVAAATGFERLTWPSHWSIGHGQHGSTDRPYRGGSLAVRAALV